MKRLFCLLALIIISEFSFSQDSLRLTNSLEFYVMPLSLIPYTPRIRVGAELNYEKFGYSLDVGLGRYAFHKNKLEDKTWGEDYLIIELRPEVKYFLKNKVTNNFYIAGELFFIYVTDNLKDGLYHTPESFYYQNATVNQINYGIHAKGGYKIVAFKKLIFDIYYGLGISFKHIYYTNVIGSDQLLDTNFVDEGGNILIHIFHPKRRFKDAYDINNPFALSISLGVKIGLIHWKK